MEIIYILWKNNIGATLVKTNIFPFNNNTKPTITLTFEKASALSL